MHITLNPAQKGQESCPRCHSPLKTVQVHGHEQCMICKSNIFECCSGEKCDPNPNPRAGQLSQNNS